MENNIVFMNHNDFFSSSFSQQYVDYCESVYSRLSADPYAKREIRKRSYQKYHFNKEEGIKKSEDNKYLQTYIYNNKDGGVVREFGTMPEGFEHSSFIKKVLKKDISHMLNNYSYLFERGRNFSIGVHPIRYSVTPESPSFSSPLWLHKDDEKLV